MSKLTIVLRVGLITILLVTSTVLLISNYDFPTYAAGGMLGVCLFTLLFPFIYVFLNKEARRNKSVNKHTPNIPPAAYVGKS
jgi:hypothetical protein